MTASRLTPRPLRRPAGGEAGRRAAGNASAGGTLRGEVVLLTGDATRGTTPAAAAERALRAGASSVVAPMWPVDPGAERRFVEAVRLALDAGESCAAAVRSAVETVRRRSPAARDWGAWCVFGTGGPVREVPS